MHALPSTKPPSVALRLLNPRTTSYLGSMLFAAAEDEYGCRASVTKCRARAVLSPRVDTALYSSIDQSLRSALRESIQAPTLRSYTTDAWVEGDGSILRDLSSRSRTRRSASASCAGFIAFFTEFLVRVSWSSATPNHM